MSEKIKIYNQKGEFLNISANANLYDDGYCNLSFIDKEYFVFSYYDDKDINIDVTKITIAWYSSSIPNNGFIVKQEQEFINDINVQPHLKYFSIDTHTIYPPCLEFKWNDTIINSGSLSFITTQPFEVSINNNPGIFYSGSINKFRVFARPTYPTRVFQTASLYTQNSYLPTSSYYAIKDLDTNEYVVDFDSSYTKLSIDTTSSYFSLNMNGFEPERYYKILIQTIVEGNTITLDCYAQCDGACL